MKTKICMILMIIDDIQSFFDPVNKRVIGKNEFERRIQRKDN